MFMKHHSVFFKDAIVIY